MKVTSKQLKGLVLGFIVVLVGSQAQAIMAPHNETNTIQCSDCHLMEEWWGSQPQKTGDYFLKDCEQCHTNTNGSGYTRNAAPAVQTHSSVVIGSERYGQWQMECEDCHGHQISSSALVEGTFSTYGTDGLTSTLTLDLPITVNDANWADMTLWPKKSGADRGLILALRYFDVAEDTHITRSFEVTDTSDVDGTVTVNGAVGTLADGTAPDGTFEIYYGQFIRENIRGQYNAFFSGPTTFADNDTLAANGDDSTPDGICQVCHSQTKHWRQDGTLTANHYSGKACTACHSHTQGFKPRCDLCHGNPPVNNSIGVLNSSGGTDGLVFKPVEQGPTGSQTAGTHVLHASTSQYAFDCTNCHFNGMPATDVIGNKNIQIGFDVYGYDAAGTHYDGQQLSNGYGYEGTNGTTVSTGGAMQCSNVYCHSQGKRVLYQIQDFDLPSTSPSWGSNGDVDGDGFSCNNCHGYPPTFDAHKTHVVRGFDCNICHIGTTPNGLVISDKSMHVNGVYDVFPDTQFYARRGWHALNFDYTFYPDGGVCSGNTCHQLYQFGDPKKWRNSPQEIADATLSFADAGECLPGAATGDITVSVALNCVDCVAPYTCDFDWGDGSVETGVPCDYQHTYDDIVPHAAPDGSIVDPNDTVIGGFDVTWTIRDRFNVTLASGQKTTRVSSCGISNVDPVPAFSIGKGPDPAIYDVCVTDFSTDSDYNVGTHYDPNSPSTGYAAPGTIKIDWGGYAADGSGKGITETPLFLTDQPNNQQFCFVYDRGGFYYVRHSVKDNDATSGWILSPLKLYKVTR